MGESKDHTGESGTDLYPIRTVSHLTGVNAITLRAWERRYGFFKPVRTDSGHRMYTQEHINLITRVVGLIEHGMRIGQVKAKLDAEEVHSGGALTEAETLWKRYLDRMVTAVIQFDEAGLEMTYGEALSLYPVDTVTKNLLGPLLSELGRRWEENTGSIAEEHFFGFYLRNKLGARFHHRPRQASGTTILLACLPGDRHETGLLMFALAASNAGYHTILLGADMPIVELPAAAKKTDSKAIVLSGLIRPSARVLEQELPGLKRAVGIPVFLGGQASTAAHDALKKSGITPLGTDMDNGLQRICETVPISSGG
jgi:DNA-binding transcriptional MerR regulator